MTLKITRRRMISIAATFAGTALAGKFGAPASAATYRTPITWRGMALGAEAQIQLHHEDADFATAWIRECVSEISRLENLFSLYREHSALSRLNASGEFRDPGIEMIELLSKAKSFTELTDGAFDVTVQPLWQLYAEYFSTPNVDPAGPPDSAIRAALDLVGSDKISISPTRIGLAKPAMALTLNGIAQGYVTEKITNLLRRAGFTNVLVNMGENQALGGHPDDRPWTVGIKTPVDTENLLTSVPLKNEALATSGGYGSPLSPDGRVHHLLDPRTGRSANHHRSVSVIAPGATNADMLATALSILPAGQAPDILAHFKGARAIILTSDNEIVRL
jgi:FAD:protein FMN transferase